MITAFLLSLVACLQSPVAPPKPTPPRIAWPRQDTLKGHAFGMSAVVSISTLRKQLRFTWGYKDALGEDVIYEEVVGLSYWPTAAGDIDSSTLLVAGKQPSNGRTIIERWDLAWDSLPSEQAPTAIARTALYVGAAAEKIEPRTILGMVGVPNKALVQYRSGSIFELNTKTGFQAPLFTTTQIPKLALESIVLSHSAEHPTMGYAYIYECLHSHFEDGGVVLYDLDKDGTIDTWFEVNATDWPAEVGAVRWVKFY